MTKILHNGIWLSREEHIAKHLAGWNYKNLCFKCHNKWLLKTKIFKWVRLIFCLCVVAVFVYWFLWQLFSVIDK